MTLSPGKDAMFEWFGESAWRRVKRIYREQWRFFGLFLRKYFFWAAGIFLVFAVAGYVFYSADPARAERDAIILAERVAGGIPPDASPVWIFLFILWNNIRATAIGCALGVIPFLFVPALGAAVNGVAMGLVAAFSGDQALGAGKLAAGILPHGILELPAVWLADALGLFLCAEIGRRIRRFLRRSFPGRNAAVAGGASPPLADSRDEIYLGDVLVTFGGVVLPLLIIAAAVESFITPLVFAALRLKSFSSLVG
jgi:stage II sporulation protein M